MCEIDDFEQFSRSGQGMTRREFGRLTLGAGLAASLPGISLAAETRIHEIDIKTPDGGADAFFVHPTDDARHPAVLIWPDIFGLRTAFREMAIRLAGEGYAVLVVNPFYRRQRSPVAPDHADFSDPALRESLNALRATLTPETAKTDARAFVDFLDQQAVVDTRRGIGTAGYCMGGPLVFRTAAARPDRVAAAASFHGGGLATDKPDSPHLLISTTRAQFLIAVAENDDAKEPAVKDRLREAFEQAKRLAEIEVYAGTKHGWCPPDSRVYDHAAAEKAWSRLLALFQRSLKA